MRKQSTFEFSFLSLLAIANLALMSLGCMRSDSLGSAGEDDSGVDGTASNTSTILLPDASTSTFASLPDSGTRSQDNGTCPLLLVNGSVHYPSETHSPCPVAEPADVNFCPNSLVGVTCVYPSSLSPGFQDVWACNTGPDANPWIEYQRACKRTGDDCLVGAPSPGGLSGARIELASTCASRPVVSCPVVSTDTAQTALDNVMATLVWNCLKSTGAATRGALSVFFDGDCPTSFVVDPTELTACVQAQLESERLDCASGLLCGASSYVSVGCDLC